MCRLRNIVMRDNQEKRDYGTDRQTDAGQSDPYVPLCFAGHRKTIFVHFDIDLLRLDLEYQKNLNSRQYTQ